MPRQHQIVPRRDVGLPAGFDQRRSAGFTQDGGTGDAIAGAQLVTNDGQTYAAATSELLTRQVLGYPLPLTQLADWVRGRASVAFDVDDQGRPLRLRDDAWRIDYEYDSDDAQALPSRLVAQRSDGVELRLRIDEWIALPTPSSSALPPGEDSR